MVLRDPTATEQAAAAAFLKKIHPNKPNIPPGVSYRTRYRTGSNTIEVHAGVKKRPTEREHRHLVSRMVQIPSTFVYDGREYLIDIGEVVIEEEPP